MKTLDQYMPTMREAGGRWFFPRTSIVGTGVAAALLVSAVVFAYRYPTIKADEAAQRLEQLNTLTTQATAGTQAALSRLALLVADQPEWLQKMAAEQTANIQGLLAQVQPLPRAQVLQQAEAQQAAWDDAQRLIAASPFQGLKQEQIPLNEEGKAYLDALEVQRPSRFNYQRLADGVDLALPALQAAIRLQAEAETLTHRLDVRLNGDKAAPLGKAAAAASGQPTPAAEPVRPRAQAAMTQTAATAPTIQGATDSLGAAMREAEREAERQKREAERDTERQQQEAETAARRAEQQAKRKQQEAEREAVRQQREAEAKARAAAAAEARAEREAERQADQQRIAAQRAAEAKQRECTSSIVARARCAAEGYNPLTGLKN